MSVTTRSCISFGSGGFRIVGNAPRVDGTLAFDASLDVTGHYEQTATGTLRLFIAGSDPGVSYSQLRVGENVTLDGSLQIVLQPELFSQFGFQLTVGSSFDLVTAQGGIALAPGLRVKDLVTAAGATDPALAGLTLSAFQDDIASDPDSLLVIDKQLFSVGLAGNGTVLRATYLGPAGGTPSAAARIPGWSALLLCALLLATGTALARRPSPIRS